MLKHFVTKDNVRLYFGQEAEARQYALEHGAVYGRQNEWRFYDPTMRNSTTSFRTITGQDLTGAIEDNIKPLLGAMGFVGASGYTLRSARLFWENDRLFFEVCGWPFSEALVNFSRDMLSEATLKRGRVEILDVAPSDLGGLSYDFEIGNVG